MTNISPNPFLWRLQNVIGMIAALLITLSVTLVFPVLVFHIVYEKEHKLRAMMLMMGLEGCYRGTVYYLSQTWYYIKEHV